MLTTWNVVSSETTPLRNTANFRAEAQAFRVQTLWLCSEFVPSAHLVWIIAKQAMSESERALHAALVRIEAMDAQMDQLRADFGALRSTTSDVKEENIKLHARLKKLESNIGDGKAETKKIQARVKDVESTTSDLQTENGKLEKRIRVLETQCAAMEKTLACVVVWCCCSQNVWVIVL